MAQAPKFRADTSGLSVPNRGYDDPAESKQRAGRGRRRFVRADLPTYYYHTNFVDMLAFIQERYDSVFDTSHRTFLKAFYALPLDAQYLYVRIAGRKGRVFDRTKLIYPEINQIDAQFKILKTQGFVGDLSEEDYSDYLNRLTKPDLVTVLSSHCPPRSFRRSWKKQDLAEFAKCHLPFDTASIPDTFFVQGEVKALRFLMFLYFGKIEENLQSFTLRDLGITKTPDYKADYSARFDTTAEAASAFFYTHALYRFKQGRGSQIAELIDTLDYWPDVECEVSLSARDKLLQKLGGLSEACKDVQTALRLYGASEAPLCTERAIRLRWLRNEDSDRDWVKSKLETLIENPSSDGEHNFACDFYDRKFHKKRTSAVTDLLNSAEVLTLDACFAHEPERAAQRAFIERGYTVHRTENTIWKGLFGLLFWEPLFGSDAKIHNGFERLPANLKTGTFYDDHAEAIERALQKLSDPQRLKLSLLKTVARHHGTPNGIFRWSSKLLPRLQALLDGAPTLGLQSMMRAMAKDYKGRKDGYPDLMLSKDGALRFIEIKAQGDVLRRHQFTRIAQMREAGFTVDLTRVDWGVDPNQTYVVVDVETTGGRPGLHRLTEIGAVKVRNGKVIDSFQSLLNPERSIPPFITKLTGISAEMVKDAPLFRDIAEDFKTFMGEGVFVAHNVNFDFKFINFEYRNIGKSFRHAKLCTCATMRKLYPGLKSYSLKNLCLEYGIELTSHHRALCDAKAAAELLYLINDKRCAQTDTVLS